MTALVERGTWEVRQKPESLKVRWRAALAQALAALAEDEAIFIPANGHDLKNLRISKAYMLTRLTKAYPGRRYRQHLDRVEGGIWLFWVAERAS